MNDISLLDQLIDNLENECIQLNQELHESNMIMNDSSMFNPYPTPVEAPIEYEENILNTFSYEFQDGNKSMVQESRTFDPISISNGYAQISNIGSEVSNEELLSMIVNSLEMKNNIISNAPLGNNSCNGIDFDDLNQNLLTMQQNSVNNSIPMDVSVESLISEIQSNSVTLLETTYSNNDSNHINKSPLEESLSKQSNLTKNEIEAFYSQIIGSDV